MNDKRIPIANIYYLLCYAWDHVEERDIVRLDELDELERVHDLLGKVLAQGIFRLIRRGIDRGYREVREDLASIRGKIAVGETVKRAVRAHGRVVCEFEELSKDVLHNRILRSTLGTLLRLPNLESGVCAEVRSAYTKLNDVRVVRLSRRLFQQVQLDRNRRYYRFLLSVCELIHEQLLVDEITGEVTFSDFRKGRMEKLYEDFIIGFYAREQNQYRINHQGRAIGWFDEGTTDHNRSILPRMEADVILDAPHRRIIMDAKYYRKAFAERFGVKKLHSNNLYQLLAYLRNREATEESGPRHEGILLYPTVDDKVEANVCLEGFWIRARSIDLAQNWRNIHRDMLRLIA
ncbi:MAG: 5-methylcytosine-specific restriction endonuclease system specificity protein McrC [Gemmatimonadota bacterium]|nr:5-methylcytosine-specific restriction endonuclease system specificity protein McrC [Gemmatimonadota bacterium]